MRRLLREPLLHFLVIGAALFALYALRRPGEVRADELRIPRGEVEHLALVFERTWQRTPTPDELDGLIQDRLREEVAYREAVAMGLDRDDTIVRRRLRQKLEFLADDLVSAVRPSEAELCAFLTANAERFRLEPRLAFHQVLFRSDRRTDAAADARAALAELAAGTAAADALGDPTLLPSELGPSAAAEVDAQFGEGFAHALAELAPGAWSGPVPSTFGAHLVRLDALEEGRLPGLDEARAAVEREWFAERRQRELDALYRRLLERYQVVIEDSSAPEEPR